MARYIDADKLEEWIKQNGDKLMGEYYIEHLKECSPEDVAPIIHAEWIEHEDWQEFQDADGNWDETRIVWYECSNCHKTEYDNDYEYCPHCGAKMDKKELK